MIYPPTFRLQCAMLMRCASSSADGVPGGCLYPKPEVIQFEAEKLISNKTHSPDRPSSSVLKWKICHMKELNTWYKVCTLASPTSKSS